MDDCFSPRGKRLSQSFVCELLKGTMSLYSDVPGTVNCVWVQIKKNSNRISTDDVHAHTDTHTYARIHPLRASIRTI